MRQRDWVDVRPDATAPAADAAPERARPPDAAPERARPRQRPDAAGRPGAGSRYEQDQYGQGDDDGYAGRGPRGRGRDGRGRDEHGRDEHGPDHRPRGG